MSIHAIIWDVGGVLVRTEDFASRQQLAKEYNLSNQAINDLVFGSPGNYPTQLGEISHAEHWQAVQQKLGISDPQIADFESRFFAGDVLDTDLINFIRQLKQDFCMAILSNASSNLNSTLAETWQIDDAFHNIIVSAEVGLMKPDPAIFELTLETIGFEAQETVFIDDMPENIQAAQEVGMLGIRFQTPEQTLQKLTAIINSNDLD
ncbi:MAG: HAD family phosphatase [Chloroflexota bacterium]